VKKHDYLICYDIFFESESDKQGKKRLKMAADYLEKVAMRIQYSIFYLPDTSSTNISKIAGELEKIISNKMDDVRIYAIKDYGQKIGVAVDLKEPFIVV
jgi:CRISPR-associated endonuclease Cas2